MASTNKDALVEHKHTWVANSGTGGEPKFRMYGDMSEEPLMHVCCYECNARTWMTMWEWDKAKRREGQ